MSNEGAPQFDLIDTASVLLNSTIQLEGANPLRTLNRRGYRDSYIPKHGVLYSLHANRSMPKPSLTLSRRID